MTQNFSSHLLQRAVDEVSCLPGIGRKTALRLVLHLLRQDARATSTLCESLSLLRNEVKYCRMCHNISDTDICEICANPKRDASVLCVVENIQDVMAIENTQQFNGVYHVLGGVISPIDGVGINDLHIADLITRIEAENVKEVILALPTTMEGDTTNFYIHRQLQKFDNVAVSTIARGIAIGDNLEYADEVTLGRSILNRVPFESVFKR